MINLDTTSMERILTFAGYGNPAGPLWFIGKEEGLSQMDGADQDANLIARGRFHQVMDVQAAHLTLREGGKPYELTERQNFTQVWVWEAKFARALSGATDWQDVERAKDYIRTRLARADGQTFITNVSPIPEKGGGTQRKWQRYFEDRLPPGMLDALLGRRRRMLRDLISTHQPKAIICHGEPRANDRALVLPGVTVQTNRIETYDLADGRHVFICPFFGVGQLSKGDAEDLVKKLRERGIRLPPSR